MNCLLYKNLDKYLSLKRLNKLDRKMNKKIKTVNEKDFADHIQIVQ